MGGEGFSVTTKPCSDEQRDDSIISRVEGHVLIYTSDTPAGNTRVVTFTYRIQRTSEGWVESGEGGRRRRVVVVVEERCKDLLGLLSKNKKQNLAHLQQHSQTAQTPCRPSQSGGVGGAKPGGAGVGQGRR